jgi:hypothetical protein
MKGILDLPHYLYKKYLLYFSKYATDQEDKWYFDLGYQYAFSLSIFTIAMIYSVSTPLIPIFGSIFFALKVN